MAAIDFPWWILGLFLVFSGTGLAFYYNLIVGLSIAAGGAMMVGLHYMFVPKYPVKVEILLFRKGMPRMIKDKAARLKNSDGTFFYRFKKLKDKTLPARYESLFASDKGEIAYFFSPAPGEYHPMTIEEFTKKVDKIISVKDPEGNYHDEIVTETITPFKIIPEDLKHWLVLTQQRAKQKYMVLTTWEKWYPLIIFAIVGMIIVVTIASMFQGLNPFMKELTAATSSLAHAAETNSQVMEELAKRFPINETLINGKDNVPRPPDVV